MSDILDDLTNTLADVDIQLGRLSAYKETMLAIGAHITTSVGEDSAAEALRLATLAMFPGTIADLDSTIAEGQLLRAKLVSAIATEMIIISLDKLAAPLAE